MIHSIANNPTGKEGEAEHTVLCGRARRRDNPRGVLLTEWAYLLWKVKGSVDEARTAFMKNAQWYSDSRHFWQKWLEFELEQPTSAELEAGHSERINRSSAVQRAGRGMLSGRPIPARWISGAIRLSSRDQQ